MKRVSVELTEEEAKMLYLPKPCAYWITQEYIPAKFNESDKTVFTLNGITHDPITKEGIEGLGFILVKQHAGLPDVDFEMGDYWLEWDGEIVVVQEILLETTQEFTLFRGKLDTMKQLKDVLKWTGVL